MKQTIANLERGVRFGSISQEFFDELCTLGTVADGILTVDDLAFVEISGKYRQVAQPIRGLGDVVAKVARPIAKAIDHVAGTNLQNCGGCKSRQERLNQKFPINP